MDSSSSTCTVAIVGGGPSGLALATELRSLGVDDVVVIERESAAGGVPRHCGHYPFGVIEFKRLMKGPAYAAKLHNAAMDADVRILLATTVTELHPGGLISLSNAEGQYSLQAQRVVLCTGARESTRAQRFISGSRPQGVLPTGALQSMVYLHGKVPFRSPVILGSELVSMSAIMTCKHSGVRPVAMIEENARVTVPHFMRTYPAMNRVPVYLGASDMSIEGGQRVEAVRFCGVNGVVQTIETDGVIVSGQFRPEAALARGSHLQMDEATGGPIIDQHYRASDPSYYCTGNLLRPVENSSWCWREGKQTAATVAADLASARANDKPRNTIEIELNHPALKLVVPQRIISSESPGMSSLQLRVNQPVKGRLVARDQKTILWSGKLNALPERRLLIPIQPFVEYVNQIGRYASVELTIE